MGRPRNPSHDAVYSDDCECKAETDKAVLVEIPDLGEDTWIPKTCVHDDSEVAHKGDKGTLAVTKWIAEKIGLA